VRGIHSLGCTFEEKTKHTRHTNAQKEVGIVVLVVIVGRGIEIALLMLIMMMMIMHRKATPHLFRSRKHTHLHLHKSLKEGGSDCDSYEDNGSDPIYIEVHIRRKTKHIPHTNTQKKVGIEIV
jgi:hypothetical protein